MGDDKKQYILPMDVSKYPTKENVVGDARNFIDEFIQASNSEMIYKSMGVNPDKSFLITGPPGNGKTLGIEALVNEINKDVIEKYEQEPKGNHPFNLLAFKYDTGKYGTKYINEGSKIVQAFFDTCFTVANAGYKTLVVFDEAETLFGHRSESRNHKEDNKVLETIMKNMQILHDTDKMYSVMMSNFPEAFDKASIRSGRVDKRFVFNKPNLYEREFAYNHAVQQINEKAGYRVVRSYNPKHLAKISDGFSYADIAETVKATVRQRAKEISNTRKNKIIPAGYVTGGRLEKTIIKHRDAFKKVSRKNKIGFI